MLESVTLHMQLQHFRPFGLQLRYMDRMLGSCLFRRLSHVEEYKIRVVMG
jgi:hypothetical protein